MLLTATFLIIHLKCLNGKEKIYFNFRLFEDKSKLINENKMHNYENTGNLIPRILLSSPGNLNL